MKQLSIVLMLTLLALPAIGEGEGEDLRAELLELRNTIRETRIDSGQAWLLEDMKANGVSDDDAARVIELIQHVDPELPSRLFRQVGPDHSALDTVDREAALKVTERARDFLKNNLLARLERYEADESKELPIACRSCLTGARQCIQFAEDFYYDCLNTEGLPIGWCFAEWNLLFSRCEDAADECEVICLGG